MSAAVSAILLLSGCSMRIETRPLAAVYFTGSRTQKLNDPDIKSLMAAVSDMLREEGFTGWENSSPQWGYYIVNGERVCSEGFHTTSDIWCSVAVGRRSVDIRFCERESHHKSHVFLATEQERAAVRALAKRIEAYLRAHLPASFCVRVSLTEKGA